MIWERVPDVGTEVRERTKAMGFSFVLLDFEQTMVRGRAKRTGRSVDMEQISEVGRSRASNYVETHACSFIFYTF